MAAHQAPKGARRWRKAGRRIPPAAEDCAARMVPVPPRATSRSVLCPPSSALRFLEKCLDAGLRPAEDQAVDVVGTLVRVHRFEVAQHAHDMELVGNAV